MRRSRETTSAGIVSARAGRARVRGRHRPRARAPGRSTASPPIRARGGRATASRATRGPCADEHASDRSCADGSVGRRRRRSAGAGSSRRRPLPRARGRRLPRDTGHPATRIRALGLEPLTDEDAEARSDAVERVALGHAHLACQRTDDQPARRSGTTSALASGTQAARSACARRHDLVARQRASEQMPLPDVAAGRAQAGEVGRRLDTFCDDLKAQAVSELDRRRDDRLVAVDRTPCSRRTSGRS